MDSGFITVGEAENILDVSAAKIATLIKNGELPVYENPLDGREKLVKREDVEKLKQPRKAE